jgi:glycine/D-amino acid oxidase-like deaminating enzyme
VAARLYHDDQYDWARPVPSYWGASAGGLSAFPHLNGSLTADVAIIGAGYTGLSAAYHLAKDHAVSAVVLEAGPIGWGASGRNGGFACLGASMAPAEHLIKKFGLEETRRFFRAQLDGIDLVASIACSENFEIDVQGDGVFVVAHKPSRLAALKHEMEGIETLTSVPARLIEATQFSNEVFQSTEQYGGVWIGAGYGIHPLKYARGLAAAAATRGAKLFEKSRVTTWRKDGDRHVIGTVSGEVRAKNLVIATNGWIPEELDPSLVGRVLPIMSNIMVTRPLTDDELGGQGWKTQCPISNSRNLLYYFRLLPDKRMLFGGRGDTIGDKEAGDWMRASLEAGFRRVFPNWSHVETTHFWRGFITVTPRLTPAIGHLEDEPNVFLSYGCHGNGVAWSTWAGRALSGQIVGSGETLPAPVAGLGPRFTWPRLRIHYLRSVLTAMQFSDRWL